jgi:RHS repeat-associated protein
LDEPKALRFPGQYADSETGFFYNYFRTYLAAQGRYAQSDPIGLGGGWSRFAYAEANSLSYADPYGEASIFGVIAAAGGAAYAGYQGYQAGLKYRDLQNQADALYQSRKDSDTYTPAQELARVVDRARNGIETYGPFSLRASIGVAIAGAGGNAVGALTAAGAGAIGAYIGSQSSCK